MTTSAFAAAISQHPDAAQAVGEAVGVVLERVGHGPDVAALFVCGHPPETIGAIVEVIAAVLEPGVLIGAGANGVIGGSAEIEDGPAVSLWAGRTGPAQAVRLEVARSVDGATVVGMPRDAAVGDRTLILLTDALSFPADAVAQASVTQYPRLKIVGGMFSAENRSTNRLVLATDVDRVEIHDDGAVGILLPQGLGELVVVSQGCRPVGEPYTVTAADGNIVKELASRPAVERLGSVVDRASEEDRALLTRGLHVGLVIDESADHFDRGDFLIRGVLGIDRSAGGLRVGARVEVGTTLQFHVRDAAAADADLASRLTGVDADTALVFTGDGRGEDLFGVRGHDAGLVSAAVRGGPVGGLFCAGEFGPVHGRNHVHGFTASILFLYG